MILDSQSQITLTAIGQPLVASTNDSSLVDLVRNNAVYVPIYADYASQAGDDHWFRLLQQLELYERQPDARPGRWRRANWRSKRVADDGLALAGALAPADAATMFQDHASLFSQYPLYARRRLVEPITSAPQ